MTLCENLIAVFIDGVDDTEPCGEPATQTRYIDVLEDDIHTCDRCAASLDANDHIREVVDVIKPDGSRWRRDFDSKVEHLPGRNATGSGPYIPPSAN